MAHLSWDAAHNVAGPGMDIKYNKHAQNIICDCFLIGHAY